MVSLGFVIIQLTGFDESRMFRNLAFSIAHLAERLGRIQLSFSAILLHPPLGLMGVIRAIILLLHLHIGAVSVR